MLKYSNAQSHYKYSIIDTPTYSQLYLLSVNFIINEMVHFIMIFFTLYAF